MAPAAAPAATTSSDVVVASGIGAYSALAGQQPFELEGSPAQPAAHQLAQLEDGLVGDEATDAVAVLLTTDDARFRQHAEVWAPATGQRLVGAASDVQMSVGANASTRSSIRWSMRGSTRWRAWSSSYQSMISRAPWANGIVAV